MAGLSYYFACKYGRYKASLFSFAIDYIILENTNLFLTFIIHGCNSNYVALYKN
jgi:hypothetical protein